jgi:hypothetical protein
MMSTQCGVSSVTGEPTASSKGLLQRKGVLEQWYEFENRATERALRQWCEENDVVIVPEDGTEPTTA